MKRILSVLLTFLMCVSLMSVVSANSPKYALHTDIVAYINDAPIRSFNIDGFTGIVAEDLLQYGFGVKYDDSIRTLEVYRLNNKITSTYTPEEQTDPVGSKKAEIYDTDIKTYVNGNIVQSFNIGGETIIFIDELICYGEVIWHPDERKIRYNYVDSWSIDLYELNRESDLTQPIDSFTLNWQKTSDGYISEGVNLDYLDYLRLYYDWQEGIKFGFSFYQRTLFQTAEFNISLSETVTLRADGKLLSENADKANERIKIYINDEEQKITKVSQGKGNGHTDYYFHLDTSIDKDDITQVKVICN